MEKPSYRIEDWDITTTNLKRISENNYQVAVIPTAAIEAHNMHLPEGQDFLHTTYVSRRCCKDAWEKCRSVICLPTIPFGVDCNQMAYPMAIHVSQSTLDTMIIDIIKSLRHHGIRKVVILNGHGGNDFKPLIRQIQCDMDVFVFLCNWWTVGMDKYDTIFTKPDDHAGQMETSVAMELYPDLVEMQNAADGKTRPFRFEALTKGWVSTSRNFANLNDHCAAGQPVDSDPEKGKKYLDVACSRISEFLVELAKSEMDNQFPHIDK